MIGDDKLIVEITSTQELNWAAARQVLAIYASNLRVGLLFHFALT